jgi:hypothetical protein
MDRLFSNSYYGAIEQLVYGLLYNMMYAFSVLQIKYKRFIKTSGENRVSEEDISKRKQIELFYDGDQIPIEFNHVRPVKNMTNVLYFLQNGSGEIKMNDKSMIVYSNPRENGVIDKVILSNGDKINVDESGDSVLYYEPTEFTFISFEMVLDDLTTHPIQLKHGDDNYYIVGNVINRTFIEYYVKKYLNFQEVPQSYTLHIVDGNADFFTMNQDDTIIFEKTTSTKSKKIANPEDSLCSSSL